MSRKPATIGSTAIRVVASQAFVPRITVTPAPFTRKHLTRAWGGDREPSEACPERSEGKSLGVNHAQLPDGRDYMLSAGATGYGLASRKSFTMGTMMETRCSSVTWVVLGRMANRDVERGLMSP